MASVFKKRYTKPLPEDADIVQHGSRAMAQWVDGRGRQQSAEIITSPSGEARIRRQSSTYYAKYREANGKLTERATGCRDKVAAMSIATELERQTELVKAGVLSPAERDSSAHQRVELPVHIDGFVDEQTAKGVSEARVKFTRQRLLDVSKDCRFGYLRDLSAAELERWLLGRKAEGMSPATRNGYREAWVAFGNWCVRTGRMNENPLQCVQEASIRGDRRRQRRSLTEDELKRLLVATQERPLMDAMMIRRGPDKGKQLVRLSDSTRERLQRLGRERALIYKTLVLTGLRRNELASLTVGQLELDGVTPLAILKPADEKNREGNSIPLRMDLAADLSGWLGDELRRIQREARQQGTEVLSALPPSHRAFPVPKGLVKILNRDLELAGIPKVDDRGRSIDVHELRHTFETLLSKGGVAPRTAQAAMRHSTIDLTMNTYTDPRLLEVHQALEALPSLPIAGGRREDVSNVSGQLAPVLAPTTDPHGQTVSSCDNAGTSEASIRPSREVDVTGGPGRNWRPLSSADNGPRRIGVTGFEPATSTSRT